MKGGGVGPSARALGVRVSKRVAARCQGLTKQALRPVHVAELLLELPCYASYVI